MKEFFSKLGVKKSQDIDISMERKNTTKKNKSEIRLKEISRYKYWYGKKKYNQKN